MKSGIPGLTLLNSETVAAVKYAVSTQVLLEQVEAVANAKQKVGMPADIKKILERAIGARERCSDWYQAARQGAAKLDNGGHRHFITVLKDALSKLGGDSTAPAHASRPTAGSKQGAATRSGIANVT